MRDYHRRLIEAATEAGASEVRLAHSGGNHPRLEFRAPDGRELTLPVAWSPSDRRALRNDLARLRRMLRATTPKPDQ